MRILSFLIVEDRRDGRTTTLERRRLFLKFLKQRRGRKKKMELRNFKKLALNWEGALILWGLGANLFFRLSVILRSLVYFSLAFSCIIFLEFYVFVFMLCSLSFYVDIVDKKNFLLCFCVSDFVLIVFLSEMYVL